MLSEAGIKSAIKSAPASGKTQLELTDGGERGLGRLVLTIRVRKGRITSEWYVVYYRDQKRGKLKIGSYPTIPLADARKTFREQYAPTISAGGDPANKHVRRRHQAAAKAGTVKELFEAYVAHLRANGKRSADIIKRVLLSDSTGVAKTIGANRSAASVTAADIVDHLAKIHERGSVVMAAHTRSYISAVFNWGCKAEHDYTAPNATVNWGLTINPVNSIKTDEKAQRTLDRFLSPAEFKRLWEWTTRYNGWGATMAPIQLAMLTGQRSEEILRISVDGYDKAARMLTWDKTKNGLPHAIPIIQRAADILDHLVPNKHGLYFPGRPRRTTSGYLPNPAKPMHHAALLFSIRQFREETGVEHFTPRDLRRTFKTLAGDAGISKDMRDRLQNHARNGDVSSRHYDRYDYLSEKREALARWAEYVEAILAGDITTIGERVNVVPLRGHIDRSPQPFGESGTVQQTAG